LCLSCAYTKVQRGSPFRRRPPFRLGLGRGAMMDGAVPPTKRQPRDGSGVVAASAAAAAAAAAARVVLLLLPLLMFLGWWCCCCSPAGSGCCCWCWCCRCTSGDLLGGVAAGMMIKPSQPICPTSALQWNQKSVSWACEEDVWCEQRGNLRRGIGTVS